MAFILKVDIVNDTAISVWQEDRRLQEQSRRREIPGSKQYHQVRTFGREREKEREKEREREPGREREREKIQGKEHFEIIPITFCIGISTVENVIKTDFNIMSFLVTTLILPTTNY